MQPTHSTDLAHDGHGSERRKLCTVQTHAGHGTDGLNLLIPPCGHGTRTRAVQTDRARIWMPKNNPYVSHHFDARSFILSSTFLRLSKISDGAEIILKYPTCRARDARKRRTSIWAMMLCFYLPRTGANEWQLRSEWL